MLSQTFSVSAATYETVNSGVQKGIGSGYTLYIYRNNTSDDLAYMYLTNSGTKVLNTFTATSYCAPRAWVGTSSYTGNMNSAGGFSSWLTTGQSVTASMSASSSTVPYGYTEVKYDVNSHI